MIDHNHITQSRAGVAGCPACTRIDGDKMGGDYVRWEYAVLRQGGSQ